MQIVIKVGAGNPDLIDAGRVAAEMPYGDISVEAEKGGLDVPSENGKDLMVIVNVAILVGFED